MQKLFFVVLLIFPSTVQAGQNSFIIDGRAYTINIPDQFESTRRSPNPDKFDFIEYEDKENGMRILIRHDTVLRTADTSNLTDAEFTENLVRQGVKGFKKHLSSDTYIILGLDKKHYSFKIFKDVDCGLDCLLRIDVGMYPFDEAKQDIVDSIGYDLAKKMIDDQY